MHKDSKLCKNENFWKYIGSIINCICTISAPVVKVTVTSLVNHDREYPLKNVVKRIVLARQICVSESPSLSAYLSGVGAGCVSCVWYLLWRLNKNWGDKYMYGVIYALNSMVRLAVHEKNL